MVHIRQSGSLVWGRYSGVPGGINAFGLIGLFLGPVLLAVSIATWREWQGHKRQDLA